MTPRERRFYVLAILLCLILRVSLVAGTDGNSVSTTRWSSFAVADVYDQFGWNLASEGVYGVGERPSAWALPAYPLLLAGTYKAVGHHYPGAARWLQVVLSVLAVLALGRLARCLGGARSEIVAVALGAIYPYFLYFVPAIVSETLFLFAFSGMLFTAVRVGRTGNVSDGLLHGVCLTVAVMTRFVGLLIEPGVLLLARPWSREHRKRRLTGLLLGYLIFGLAWGGWVARNRAVFGETVLFDTHGGFALYMGQLYARDFDVETVRQLMGYGIIDIARGRLPDGPRGELEADRRCKARALQMIREDPGAFLATLPKNIYRLWLWLDFSDVGRQGGLLGLVTFVGWLSYVPVFLLGFGGLWRAFRTRRFHVVGAALVIVGLTSMLHAVMLGGKRYRIATIDPVLLVLAAWQVDCLVRSWWRRVRRSPGGPAEP